MTKPAYIGLIILAVLVGIFIGYCIWTPTWETPHLLKYDILKDTLTIVLAVSAVGIGVIGLSIYLILSGRLRSESALASRIEAIKGSMRLFIHAGYVFWDNYDKAAKKDSNHLEIAIGLTERALTFYQQLPNKEMEDRYTQRSFCLIKNNLAYYFALRKRAEDKDRAREYAEYIRAMTSEYTEERENWLDTYNFVKQQYPD
jgi:hypothetical protein